MIKEIKKVLDKYRDIAIFTDLITEIEDIMFPSRFENIFQAVSFIEEVTKIPQECMFTVSNQHSICWERNIYQYCLHRLFGYTSVEIGRIIPSNRKSGYREHTTVLHSVTKCENDIYTNFKNTYNIVEKVRKIYEADYTGESEAENSEQETTH